MDTPLEKLAFEALKLTSSERAAFAQLLLASLEGDAQSEEELDLEVERRIGAIENGATQLIPMADALAQVRAMLK